MATSKQSASVSTLNTLHEAIAKYMLMRIESSIPNPDAPKEYDEDGNEIPAFFIPLAASELQVMVTFLNNNNITATPDVEHLEELAKEFTSDLELARQRKAEAITKVSQNDDVLTAILNC
jgi:hypothetical protein